MLDGVPRPDHGAGFVERVCEACRASWVGRPEDGCGWCADAALVHLEAERDMLLHPPWLARDRGRYDELSEVDKAVWDRTRGQVRGTDSVEAWERRLARAVTAGVVSEAEARRAIRQVRGR